MGDQRFSGLDGWRGICALLIALYHFDAYSHVYAAPFVRNSWLFVDFFFVLSGFVITHAMKDKLADRGDAWRFVLRRFGRLWPLHACVLAFLVATETSKLVLEFGGFPSERPAFSGNTSVETIITNLLLIHSLDVHNSLLWNTSSWSISTEFYTYFVFAALCMTVRSRIMLSAAAVAIMLGSVAIIALYSSKGIETTFDFGFFRCLYGFFAGHLVYRLWQRGHHIHSQDSWFFLEVLALILVIAFVSNADSRTTGFAAPLIFGFAIWIFAHERGPVSNLMKSDPIRWLGERSYSIYMIHILILALCWHTGSLLAKIWHVETKLEFKFPWADEPVSLYAFANQWVMDGLTLAYLAAVISLAALTYKAIERPCKTYFDAIASGERNIPALIRVLHFTKG